MNEQVDILNLLKETVNVRLDGQSDAPKCYHNCEVCVLRNGKGSRDGIEIPAKRPERYVEPRSSEDDPFAFDSDFTPAVLDDSPAAPAAEEGGDLFAGADVQGHFRELIIPPGVSARADHPAAQLFPGGSVPGVEVDDPGEFLHREGAEFDVVLVYHCATVALKMSSQSFSMISTQRDPSTDSSDWVES